MKVCSVDGCEKPFRTRGLCPKHYAKLRKYGDPLGQAPERPRFCSVDGCNRPRCARGLCNSHWARWRTHGDPSVGGQLRTPPPRIQGNCSIPGCKARNKHRGLCGHHYGRDRRYGDPLALPTWNRRPPEERFWEKVDKRRPDECWPWTASVDLGGYGKFLIAGKVGGPPRLVRAHRFSYEKSVGPIPKGKVIDHRCRNRKCVNPSHLRIATHKQNCENREWSSSTRSKSGVRGVRWNDRSSTWEAHVTHNYKGKTIGGFATIAEAAAAAQELRRHLFTHNDDDWDGVEGQLEIFPIIQPGTGVQVHSMKRGSNA